MSITGCRNDALVQLLNGLGYQPINLPLTGLTPPNVYSFADGKLTFLGDLVDYLPAGTAVPPLRTGQLDDIQHRQTSRKKVSEAASFLGDALKCIGITSAPKLDLSFLRSTEITFSFSDVTYQMLDPAKVQNLIGVGLKPNMLSAQDLREGAINIVYNYAFAGSLSLTVAQLTDSSIEATALQIQQIFNLGAKASVRATSADTITFNSTTGTRAAFACKLGQLLKRGTHWYFSPQADAGSGFLADEVEANPYLLERGVVFNVDTAPDPA